MVLPRALKYIYENLNLTESTQDTTALHKKSQPSEEHIILFYKTIFNKLNSMALLENIHSYLNKYIYMNSVGQQIRNNNWEFIKVCNKNFLIYIVTVENSNARIDNIKDANKPSKSSSPQFTKSETSLSKHSSKSRIPIISSRTSLTSSSSKKQKHGSVNNIPQKMNEEKESKTQRGYDIFKKIIGLHKSKSYFDEIFMREYNYDTEKSGTRVIEIRDSLPSSFIPNLTPYVDFNLAQAMREMIEIRNKVEESEVNVKNMLVKYIHDTTLENDLVNSVCGHGKLLLESERRALNLSSESWFQQAEIYKEQQRALQDTLNSIVMQNRDLQGENEALVRTNERLNTRLVLLHETAPSTHKVTKVSSSKVLESLNRNNEKLRGKISCMSRQIIELEQNLKKYQKKSYFMQQQLSTNNGLMQNSKAIFERAKGDYELEVARLLNEIQTNSIIIKDTVEAGDVLLEDLDALKSQVKLSKAINWDKFKRRGKSICDLIHLSRSCINELSRELNNQQNLNKLQLQNIENLKDEVIAKNARIEELEDEKQKWKEESLEYNETENNLKSIQDRFVEMGEKLSYAASIIENKKGELLTKENFIKEYVEQVQSLSKLVDSKTEALVKSKSVIKKLQEEKNTYEAQVNGLAQVISATGTGEIAKELVITQEKLSQFQDKYYSVEAEKNYLLKQIESNTSEKQTLIAYQQSCYGQLKLMQKDVEGLEKNNENLKEQLETEKQTVTALQSERVRALEEKNNLSVLCERLKLENENLQQLQGAVTTINKKANKLAMIAQYNKQVGEQLQSEVAERDVAITELQNNVKELSEIHQEAAKQKVALCEELTQVCTVKDKLNYKLTTQLEKNLELKEWKKKIKIETGSQLKIIEAKYEKEHLMVKSLMRDLKNLRNERDLLENINRGNEQKLYECTTENVMINNELVNIKAEYEELEKKVKMLTEQNQSITNSLEQQFNEMQTHIQHYMEKECTMEASIQSLSEENENLTNSVNYLQTETTKLHGDLNKARKNEIEHKNSLDSEREKNLQLTEDLKSKVIQIETIVKESDQLKDQIHKMNQSYESMRLKYAEIIDESNQLEIFLNQRFASDKVKDAISEDSDWSTAGSNTKALALRDEEILVLQDKIRNLESYSNNFTDVVKEITEERDLIVNTYNVLQNEYNEIANEHEQCLQKSSELESKIETMESECVSTALYNLVLEEVTYYKQIIEEQKGNFQFKLDGLKSDIFNLTTKLNDAVNNCDIEKEEKKTLQAAHKTLAMKLFKAIQLLVSEKYVNQKVDSVLNAKKERELELNNKYENECLKCTDLQKQVNELTATLNAKPISESKSMEIVDDAIVKYENHILMLKDHLNEEREENLRMQENYSDLESKCSLLEFQKCEAILRLHEIQSKIQVESLENKELNNAIQCTLAALQKMRDGGLINQKQYSALIDLVRASCNI